jgi:protein-tyrosine phosphatase
MEADSIVGGSRAGNEGSVDPVERLRNRALDREQVCSLALFDGEWYSSMLGYDVSYLGLAADDEPGYDMRKHFEESVGFLAECRKEGRKVLIHCIMGINRSSTALVAFLCEGMGMNLREAIQLASERRGYILSNASFLDQLVSSYGPGKSENSFVSISECSEDGGKVNRDVSFVSSEGCPGSESHTSESCSCMRQEVETKEVFGRYDSNSSSVVTTSSDKSEEAFTKVHKGAPILPKSKSTTDIAMLYAGSLEEGESPCWRNKHRRSMSASAAQYVVSLMGFI